MNVKLRERELESRCREPLVYCVVNTRINLPDNRSVTIPHGTLANGNINNYTRNPVRRLEWKINLEYGTDSDACIAKLLEIVSANEMILDENTPGAAKPMAAVFELSDSAVTFVARGWVLNANYWDAYFAVNDAIYKGLPAAGFKFPFPQLDVHFRQVA